MFLKPITEQKILLQIGALNQNESTPINGIPIKFIKLTAGVITPILTSFYNKCLLEGIFPNILKTAHITPCIKKAAKAYVAILVQFQYYQLLARFLKNVLVLVYTHI